ncbi:hypothetical protein HMPREF9413_3795 [Paenibacillus sp. HGF7]|nr:hypothetical protein HMPREF9413_3795 [Paenibacillus sp. HGF7]
MLLDLFGRVTLAGSRFSLAPYVPLPSERASKHEERVPHRKGQILDAF